MEERSYFRRALSDFMFEAASGGAIRHLADMGYTVSGIMERLDYPVSYERVRRAVWEHFLENETVLTREPGGTSRKEKAVYVREYDRFGKPSFRRVVEEAESEGEPVCWKERVLGYGHNPEEEISVLLEAAGEAGSYMSCDFGLAARQEPGRYQEMLSALEEGHRQYISGLPWEGRTVYHKLDPRMKEILICLCGMGQYRGSCYFPGTREKVGLYPRGWKTPGKA